MSDSIQRNTWIFGKCKSILNDKEALQKQIISQMLNKTITIFKYNNLPETITEKDIEIITQVNGYSIWKEVDGKLYVFYGSLGGEPNPYYLPTLAIIANPALRYNASLKIDEECVVMLNDYLYTGLMPLFNKYGSLLTEADISLKYAIINARVPALLQSDNDNTYKSALAFFQKIEDGDGYGVIASKEFFEGIKSQDFYKQPYIKDLIESIQYIKASWYNEIGLNSQFNMKREAINSAESRLNDDILHPTIDVMLQCRKNAVEKINKMFGTNITVELNSVWEQNKIEEDLLLQYQKAEVDNLKKENTTKEGDENETVRDPE